VDLIYTRTCVASVGNGHSFQSCRSPEELKETELYVNVYDNLTNFSFKDSYKSSNSEKSQAFISDIIFLYISASRERRPSVPDKEDSSVVTRRPCGRRHKKRSFVRPRIVGGSLSLPGSHPWTAAIYIGDSFCGGSLIQTCWVVSAAHCFANR